MLILGISAGPGCAQQIPSEPALDQQLLFAPNEHWQSVQALPVVSLGEVQALSSELRRAYLESPVSVELRDSGNADEAGCSFIERTLQAESVAHGRFVWLGDSADPAQRILYTGSSQCSESLISLIWQRDSDRWRVQGYLYGEALQFESSVDSLLLRLPACCADRVDVYRLQSWSTAEPHAQVGVDVQTLIPGAMSGAVRVATAHEGLLRRSPERDDAPNEMLSLWAETPVFGNQLDRFRADVIGWISARTTDAASGEAWCFVSLPRTAQASPTEGVFGVQAGWTECEHLHPAEP